MFLIDRSKGAVLEKFRSLFIFVFIIIIAKRCSQSS